MVATQLSHNCRRAIEIIIAIIIIVVVDVVDVKLFSALFAQCAMTTTA